jgi:hypothetical protein
VPVVMASKFSRQRSPPMNSGRATGHTFTKETLAKVDLMTSALPPIVDHATWRAALDELRKREKAARSAIIMA